MNQILRGMIDRRGIALVVPFGGDDRTIEVALRWPLNNGKMKFSTPGAPPARAAGEPFCNFEPADIAAYENVERHVTHVFGDPTRQIRLHRKLHYDSRR
jgi:hypothetical protein